MGRQALSDVDSNGRDLDANADETSGQSVSARVSTWGGGAREESDLAVYRWEDTDVVFRMRSEHVLLDDLLHVDLEKLLDLVDVALCAELFKRGRRDSGFISALVPDPVHGHLPPEAAQRGKPTFIGPRSLTK